MTELLIISGVFWGAPVVVVALLAMPALASRRYRRFVVKALVG